MNATYSTGLVSEAARLNIEPISLWNVLADNGDLWDETNDRLTSDGETVIREQFGAAETITLRHAEDEEYVEHEVTLTVSGADIIEHFSDGSAPDSLHRGSNLTEQVSRLEEAGYEVA